MDIERKKEQSIPGEILDNFVIVSTLRNTTGTSVGTAIIKRKTLARGQQGTALQDQGILSFEAAALHKARDPLKRKSVHQQKYLVLVTDDRDM